MLIVGNHHLLADARNITVKKTNTYSSKTTVGGDGYNWGILTNQLVTVTRNGASYIVVS